MDDLKLTVSSLGHCVQAITGLLTGNPKKTYRLSVKEWREKRSLSQNALYWKWLDEINQQSPLFVKDSPVNGSELWHEVFKEFYCPAKTIENRNASLDVKSTKMLDVGEMTFYLNRIENFCIDRGVILTIPEDSEYYKLMEYQTQC